MIDLGDPALYAEGDPVAAWARLRREAPVWRNERPDGSWFWAVTSHRHVSEVLRDHARFTSEDGMRLDADPVAGAAAARKMLVVTDPPRHSQIRGVMNTAFTPRMVRRLEEHMHSTVDSALEEAVELGEVDFAELAAALPVSVICDLLGVPPQDWKLMRDLTQVAFGDAGDEHAKTAAHAEILAYYAELLELRRREPAEDIITALATAVIDGVPLTEEEIFLNCDGLISGGNETTRHAAAGGALALSSDPAQWAALRADSSRVAAAVPEILRFTSPGLHVLRTARCDLELGGRQIKAGDKLAMWLPSANRDEEIFADPERFDSARDARKHIAFGLGTHYCLGSALSTLELTVFFGKLVTRVEGLELTGPVRRLSSNLIWGIDSMPVRLHGRRSPARRQTMITGIWREVLGRDHVGPHDDFFASGGDGLRLMRMRSRLHDATGRDPGLLPLLRHPTPASLARHTAAQGEWLVRPRERAEARVALVVVPYAGGSASSFAGWAELLDAEVWIAQLPGRGRRLLEPSATTMADVVGPLVQALRGFTKPIVLFGHSLGGLIAYELAARLGSGVEHLVVSAARPPHLPTVFGAELDDDALRDWMTRMGAVPAEALADPELLALLLPALRADREISASYSAQPTGRLDCPITALVGTRDPMVTSGQVGEWAGYTRGPLSTVEIDGGHMFVHENSSATLEAVAAAC